MLTYTQAQELFARARNKNTGKKLENNTYLVQCGDSFGVKLHNTIVVLINPDGSYQLNSGGWQTATTKDRINGYAPVTVHQQKYNWYVLRGNAERDVEKIPFVDGMVITNKGKIVIP